MTWEPTNEFRWLHRPTSDGVGGAFMARVLQQKWVEFGLFSVMDTTDGQNLMSYGGRRETGAVDWRDVPEVEFTETKNG